MILFDKERLGIDSVRSVYRFSVGKAKNCVGMYNRTVVIHEGSDMGDGAWRCSKRDGENCVHIMAARRYMRKEQNVDSEDKGDEGNGHVNADGIDICKLCTAGHCSANKAEKYFL